MRNCRYATQTKLPINARVERREAADGCRVVEHVRCNQLALDRCGDTRGEQIGGCVHAIVFPVRLSTSRRLSPNLCRQRVGNIAHVRSEFDVTVCCVQRAGEVTAALNQQADVR